jgi:hypothetical protein
MANKIYDISYGKQEQPQPIHAISLSIAEEEKVVDDYEKLSYDSDYEDQSPPYVTWLIFCSITNNYL